MLTSVLSRTEYPALKITLIQSKFPLGTKTTYRRKFRNTLDLGKIRKLLSYTLYSLYSPGLLITVLPIIFPRTDDRLLHTMAGTLTVYLRGYHCDMILFIVTTPPYPIENMTLTNSYFPV